MADVVPPNNDQCPNAIPMSLGVPYSVNTLNATETNDPQPACVPALNHGVWYTFTSTVTRAYALTTCGSPFPTALAVYQGGCGSTNLVACTNNNGPYCGGGFASLNFTGTAGTVYQILAGSVAGTAGDLRILLADYDLVSSGLVTSNLFTTNLPPNTLVAGRNAQLTWTVSNAGSNTLSASWTDRLSISNASTNVVLNFSPSGTLGSGVGYVQGVSSYQIPAISNGTYTVYASSDASGQIAESSEANNVITATVFVVNLPPTNVLLTSFGSITQTTCIPLSFPLTAQATAGSYPISKIEYFDGGTKIGESANAAKAFRAEGLLAQGVHSITAQAVDLFGYRATSQVTTVTLNWPELNRLFANLATNREVVCCMGAQPGSNYVVEASTLMQNSPPWQDYLTNRVVGTNILIFTNHLPLLPERYFRVRRQP